MEELLDQWQEYRDYVRHSKGNDERYLNFKDFMSWLRDGIVY